jgi:hypothetical protein
VWLPDCSNKVIIKASLWVTSWFLASTSVLPVYHDCIFTLSVHIPNTKVVVKWPLCTFAHYAMNIYGSVPRWRWVVSSTPQPLYCQERSPQYPVDRRLVGLQSQSGCYGEEKSLSLAENHTLVIQPIYVGFARCE